MLRLWVEEENQEQSGRFKQITELLGETVSRFEELRRNGDQEQQYLRLLTWMKSLETSLDELEQSVYCADRFGNRIARMYLDAMTPDEQDDYKRHLYYYKNAFIRVFSVLDKLGSYMNDRFSLHTERMKERYSYFTVLRRLRETRAHDELYQRLNDIKQRYRAPVQDLRLMRNHEVHAMNTELLDEQGRIRVPRRDGREEIDDLKENNELLQQGFEMVCESLYAVLWYCRKRS